MRKTKTGIKTLDKALGGGLEGGTLTLIAGRAGVGKTSLACQIIGNIAKSGKQVLFFSLEESREWVLLRMKRQFVDIPRGIDIDDSPDTTAEWIYRKLNETNGVVAVFIDYIQLLSCRQRLSNLTKFLKAVAVKFNIPIVFCSPLKRDLNNGPRKATRTYDPMRFCRAPSLDDVVLWEIMQKDCDIVAFIHRAYAHVRCSEFINRGEVIVAKNCYGGVGSVPVVWNKESCLFEEE